MSNLSNLKPGDIVYVYELFSECNATRTKFASWVDERKTQAKVKVGVATYTVEASDMEPASDYYRGLKA